MDTELVTSASAARTLAVSIFGFRKVLVLMLYVSPMKYDDCSEFDPLPKVNPLLESVLPCAR